jgi:UDP-N-acetyl-D-glucosamine/UDP-N-acetyl-D-galactosamine dehydrogenase
MTESVAIIGLGYVGLPLALAIARAHKNTIGFDINAGKLASLKNHIDPNGEVPSAELSSSSITFTSNPADLKKSTFFIVCVPTPVDHQNRPDMTPLVKASELIGSVIAKGAMVVFESTVYPGVTQDICGPIIAKTSGLKSSVDFKLGYSPERINPGDKEHTVERITKIVSGEDADALGRASAVYGAVVKAGIYQAPSIRVAEAAKVIENTQRDVNIALMNELSMLFDRLGLRTSDVLAAAGTKWNFLPFKPGLVGGHCIGVDPYYLTAKAEEVGFHPQMILAGRRINDGVAAFVAQKTAKLISQTGANLTKARVGILGLTFKENVSDIRNSKVPEIVRELREFGIQVLLHDPIAESAHAQHEYGLALSPLADFKNLDAVIVAVAHKEVAALTPANLVAMLTSEHPGVIIDIKSIVPHTKLPPNIKYWSL